MPLQDTINAALVFDPLMAADSDSCVKTWMAARPALACRPWRFSINSNTVRITGWRQDAAVASERQVYVGTQDFSAAVGERLTLSGRIVPFMRCKHVRRDAAQGRQDPAAAYRAWLWERLVDLMPSAAVDNLRITKWSQRRVLRKVAHHPLSTRVARELIPLAEAEIAVTVRDPEGFEKWLLRGVGPQKAFGYGGFVPTVDVRGEEP